MPDHRPKERDVQRAILDYLKHKRVFCYRNNSGALKSTYKGKPRFFHFGAVGSPDIICVVKGQFIGIEVKGPDGFQSQAQIGFQVELEKAGGKYILAFSVGDVAKFFEGEA